MFDFESVNRSEYGGEAWAKYYTLSDLENNIEVPSLGKKVRQTKSDWAQLKTPETALLWLKLTVSEFLSKDLSEPSSWALLNTGPWEATSRDHLKNQTHLLVDEMGCHEALSALPLFCFFLDSDALYGFELKSEKVVALAAISETHCFLFFQSNA